MNPQPFVQGKTAVIEITGADGLEMSGALDERPLHFFPDPGNKGYVGLQGIHAMTEPGLFTLVITGTLPIESPYFGAPFAFSQAVLVDAGDYVLDPVLIVSPETIDPAVTKPEDAQWAALTTPVTPEKLWDDPWQSPAPPPYHDCWPSRYGSRRSYNGSAYIYFHTGLDGEALAAIKAPRSVMLPVSAPFHSTLMKPAAEKLAKALEPIAVQDLKIPVLSNVEADFFPSKNDIKRLLTKQVDHPVRWIEEMEKIVREGVDKCVDIGPGKVLNGLVRKISRETAIQSIENPDSIKEFLAGL